MLNPGLQYIRASPEELKCSPLLDFRWAEVAWVGGLTYTRSLLGSTAISRNQGFCSLLGFLHTMCSVNITAIYRSERDAMVSTAPGLGPCFVLNVAQQKQHKGSVRASLPIRRPRTRRTPSKRDKKEAAHGEAHKQSQCFTNCHEEEGTTILIHKPESTNTLMIVHLIEVLTQEGVVDAWYISLPARIGHNACLDASIAALVMSCWYYRGWPGITLEKYHSAVGNALAALKTAMSTEEGARSDETLASIAALLPVNGIASRHSLLDPSHLKLVVALLAARPPSAPTSDIAKRILQYHFCDSHVMASIQGIASPLENIDRSYYDARDPWSTVTVEMTLRAIGNELCIRLPRLIALVRAACGEYTVEALDLAVQLASELLPRKDDAAENEALHLLNVTKTVDSTDNLITHVSFHFKTIAGFEAVLYYWTMQITVLRLCWRLRNYFPATGNMNALPTTEQLQSELRRFGHNLLMSVQFARTLRTRKRRRLYAHGLLVCWGTLRDCTDIASGSTVDLMAVQAWLLSNINMALTGQPTLTGHDMDEAAELFVGGPLEGIYAELYGQRPRKRAGRLGLLHSRVPLLMSHSVACDDSSPPKVGRDSSWKRSTMQPVVSLLG